MGIVGVNSTAGRAVKCIDPSKTTKSESSSLGYTLCDLCILMTVTNYHTHTSYNWRQRWDSVSNTLQWRTKVGGSKRIRYPRRPINYIKRWALNCISWSYRIYAINILSLQNNSPAWACDVFVYHARHRIILCMVSTDVSYYYTAIFMRVSFYVIIWNIIIHSVHLIFGALRSNYSGEM